MDHGDAGYEGLDGLYDKANTKYYEGSNWLTKPPLALRSSTTTATRSVST
jgi:hypothetical protein